MAHNLLNKYIWILDTIQRYGRISRKELCRLWEASAVSSGEPLARRTFYNYRAAIDELFNIHIVYNNSTYEYYIEDDGDAGSLNNWLINSMSINGMLSDTQDIADRIMLEETPSAHKFLPTVIEALKRSHRLRLDYTPFYRVSTTEGIILEPYFVRIFKQRWYVIGYNTADRKIKTYSLDRISNIAITEETFTPPDMSASTFFHDCFGITTSNSPARPVVLRTESEQAKYLRALPLHHSQSEEIHDGYSLFTLKLCLTQDFVNEILSMGSRVTVISPPELKAMVVESLKNSLANYGIHTEENQPQQTVGNK